MRIASWSWGGRDHVGTISADGREATPLAVADASRGALPLIEALARGEPLPAAVRRAPAGRGDHAARAAAAAAAQPLLRRPQLPRARRGAGRHVFRDSLPTDDAWPIVFTKLPECVVGPHDAVRLPGAAVIGADRLRVRARRRHRPRRPRHRALARDGPCVRLHDRQRRHRARRADAPPAVGPRQELRHLLPDGPVDRRAPTSSTAATRACAAGSTASCARTAAPRDMIFDIPTLIETCSRGITLLPRRRDRHRHAGRRRHGLRRRRAGCRRGDVVRIEIDGIGAIENRFE